MKASMSYLPYSGGSIVALDSLHSLQGYDW